MPEVTPTKRMNITDAVGTSAPLATRVIALTFRESMTFLGEEISVQIGRNVDEIWPCTVDRNGSPLPIQDSQPSVGFCLRRLVPARGSIGAYVAQAVAPWANIRGVSYGVPA